MNNDQHQSEHAQEQGQPMNIAALLRAAADGELNDAQRKELDAYLEKHPEAQSQIEFEQAIKSSCARAMSGPTCPDALRAKVLAIAAESASDAQGYANRIQASNAHTRSPSFWSRFGSRSPMMSAAAALLIVAAGTLIWQSASFTSNYANDAPEGLTVQQASYYGRVSDFVVREHTRCCDDKAAQAKLIKRDIDEATQYFSTEFGHDIVVPDMDKVSGEVEFFGGGDCDVPSTPRSGHLRFDALGQDGDRISLSLFVSPDPGLLPMEEGLIYALDSQACAAAGTRLFAWISNGIQYLFVSEADDEMCAKIRALMHAPTDFGSL